MWRLETCRDDVEGAGLQLLAQVVGRPAEDGAVVQLVEGGVDQLGLGPILTKASVLRRQQIISIMLLFQK